MKDVRLIKDIPEKRLRLICGDASKRPRVGDLGESGHGYTGRGGSMVLVHFQCDDGEANGKPTHTGPS